MREEAGPAEGYTECRYTLSLVSTLAPSWELGGAECYYPNGGGWDGAEVLLHNGHVVSVGTDSVGCFLAPNAVSRDLKMPLGQCESSVDRVPDGHHRHHECLGQVHGTPGHEASALEVWIPQGQISCGEADKVMSSLSYGKPYHGIYRCYEGGTDCPHATSYDAIHGWKCYAGMGQGVCTRGNNKIRSVDIPEPLSE
jgi:hypothetical protein